MRVGTVVLFGFITCSWVAEQSKVGMNRSVGSKSAHLSTRKPKESSTQQEGSSHQQTIQLQADGPCEAHIDQQHVRLCTEHRHQ